MIYTIKIKLIFGLFAKEAWEAVLEIAGSANLHEVHHVIQQAVAFDNDHMYEFYIARTMRSRERKRFIDGEDDDFGFDDVDDHDMAKTCLKDLFPLEKDRKLFYMFDYGDEWLFQISPTRAKPHAAKPGVKYPRLLSEQGNKPEQYGEWDEE
ncbi:MAG: hypothetical protein RL497_116 [Pseudomonadota bacterium]|jgi:hypothetical protein